MKNTVFWDVAACRSYVNRRFGGKYRLHLQGIKIRERGTSVSRWQQTADRILLNVMLQRVRSVLKVNVFWNVTLFSLVKARIFGKASCPYALSTMVSWAWRYRETGSRAGSLERSNSSKNRKKETGAPFKGFLARVWRGGRITLVE
jgi:hypothetical protein